MLVVMVWIWVQIQRKCWALDPNVRKTNRLHVDTAGCPLSNWGIGYTSKTIDNFLQSRTMIGENQQLITEEPVEFKNNQLKFKIAGKSPII